jgi:hypothetical protein
VTSTSTDTPRPRTTAAEVAQLAHEAEVKSVALLD